MSKLNYAMPQSAEQTVTSQQPKFFSDKESDKFATFVSMQQVANALLKTNQQDDKQLKGTFGNSLTAMQNSGYGWGSK